MKGNGSACGKVILVGEHFVVWGGTAIALPLRKTHTRVTLRGNPASRTRIAMSAALDPFPSARGGGAGGAGGGGISPARTPDVRLRKAIGLALPVLAGQGRFELQVETRSDIPQGAGLGSSAAFSVAFCRALLDMQGRDCDDDLVAQTALSMEEAFHRFPSGIDSTTIAFETPCYVKTGSEFVVKTAPAQQGPRAGFLDVLPGAVLLLADSGERRSSRAVVQRVARFARQPKGDRILAKFTGVAESIALQTASALRKGDWEYVGLMMNENHLLLNALGVSTERLETLRNAALRHGALGAKLTGAGLGGFLLAAARPDAAARLRRALLASGATTVLVEDPGN